MNNITERVIERLRKANKCGRYSDATVERILEEVLEEELRSKECCSDKKEELKEEPHTLEEIISDTPLELNGKYKQVLIIAEDEDGYITTCAGNSANIIDRLSMYLLVKNKLKDIMLEDIPTSLIDICEKLNER